jgi:hypothetical protein
MTGVEASLPLSERWRRGCALGFALGRPHLLLPAWACATSGAALAEAAAAGAFSAPPPGTLVLAGIGWNAALVSSHLWNLDADAESDIFNGKNLFWRRDLTRTRLRRLAVASAGVALLIAALLPGTPRLWVRSAANSTLDPGLVPASVLIAATIALGAAYSLRPFRLAWRWGWDVLANGLGYGLLAPWFGLVAIAGEQATIGRIAPVTATLLPYVGSAFLWTTILDARGDARAGKRSWTVRWGERATLRAAAVLAATAALAALWQLANQVRPSDLTGNATGRDVWGAFLLLAVTVGQTALALCLCRQAHPRSLRLAVMASVIGVGLPAMVRWPVLLAVYPLWYGLWILALRPLPGNLSGARPPCAGPPREPPAPSVVPSDPARSGRSDR